MSQWGAYGYAQHGWSWQRILAHYYQGTRISTTPISRVRVLLAASQPQVGVECAGAIKVSDATGRSYTLPSGAYSVGRGLKLPVGHRSVHAKQAHRHHDSVLTVAVRRSLRSPLVFDCPSAPLEWNGRAYHGMLVVRRTGKQLSLVNSLPLDEYVQGVVAGEMPWRWSFAALEAQAVAARSYAVATLKPGQHFDLFSDTRDQVYGGIAYETEKTNLAVQRTAGTVLTWNGHVATTYFFSTSGGRTADVREVWPKLGDIPYLRSVSDPYDASSPHHEWGPIALDTTKLAKRLHAAVGAVRVIHSASGRVSSVLIGSRRVDASEFRKVFGLASTWFSVGELSLSASSAQIVYGGKLSLVARAREVGTALLQRRIGAGAWKTLRSVRGGAAITVEPQGRTVYRLSAADVRGPEVSVAVAPRLHVEPTGAGVLAGSVQPLSRGEITVSRRMAGAWRVVAHPRLDAEGEFRTPLRLRPGGYRVSVDGNGRFAAVTTSVMVTPRLLASFAR
jgi:stage II sporulation protein D